MVLLPVVRTGADGLQGVAIHSCGAAQTGLGGEFRCDGDIIGDGQHIAVLDDFSGAVFGTYKLIAGVGYKDDLNLGVFGNIFDFTIGRSDVAERSIISIAADKGQRNTAIGQCSRSNGISSSCRRRSGGVTFSRHRHGAQHHGQHQNKCQDLAYLFHSHTPPWPAASVLSVKCSFSGSSSAGAAGGS